jgi:hypothetical protein
VTPDLRHDIRLLLGIRQAKDSGDTWAEIGAAWGGVPAWRAKKDFRDLREKIKQALMAAERAGDGA